MMWAVDPWREMERMRRELEGVFSGSRGGGMSSSFPLVNVYDDDERIVVAAELPGLTKDQVQVTFHDGVLSLEGMRTPREGSEQMTLVRSERSVGTFDKSVSIPVKVDADRINAQFADGVLTVYLPKAEEAKPKKISIEA